MDHAYDTHDLLDQLRNLNLQDREEEDEGRRMGQRGGPGRGKGRGSGRSTTTTTSSKNGNPSLPTASHCLAMGNLLFQISTKETHHPIFETFEELVQSIPEFHWIYIFELYEKATKRLFEQQQQSSVISSTTTSTTMIDDDLVGTMKSLHGLFIHSSKLCQLAYSKKWISILSAIYDRFVVLVMTTTSKEILLATLSSLLLDGLLLVSSSSSNSTTRAPQRSPPYSIGGEGLLEAIQAMEAQSVDCLGDLLDWQTRKEPTSRTLESQVQIYYDTMTSSSDNDYEERQHQRDYILNMLQSARQQDQKRESIQTRQNDTTSSQKKSDRSTGTTSKSISSSADELERRIQQIKQILPEFGEGFIETALSLHQGNVETTVATLLNDPSSYPTSLRFLDRSLPRRRKERTVEEVEDSARARQVVKERVAMEEKQEQERYNALMYVADKEEEAARIRTKFTSSEYDDDYDDQYDDIDDIKLGGADEGQYDFEKVRLYNQFVRSEEVEDKFWQENINTNRISQQKPKKDGKSDKGSNEDDEQEQQQQPSWGPNKIKGGRVIGPDGTIVRKPGGQRGKRNDKGAGGNMGNNNVAPTTAQGGSEGSSNTSGNNTARQTAGGGGGGPSSNGNNNITNNNNNNGNKPRTKPKSQNRVTRHRDKKQKAQGTFGASS